MAIPPRPSPPPSHPAPSAPRLAGTNAADISASSIPSSSDVGTHHRPRNIPGRSDRSVRNGIYLQSGIVVRGGVVDVRGRGFARKFLWSSKWLELWKEALSIRDNEVGSNLPKNQHWNSIIFSSALVRPHIHNYRPSRGYRSRAVRPQALLSAPRDEKGAVPLCLQERGGTQ